jgi:hypothetical protein
LSSSSSSFLFENFVLENNKYFLIIVLMIDVV